MADPILSYPAQIDVHDGHIVVRAVGKAFTIPRSADPAVDTLALKIGYEINARKGVHISPLERTRIREFDVAHEQMHNRSSDIVFEIVPTGLGPAITVHCTECQASAMISDTDSW